MNYISTRNKSTKVTAAQAIWSGLAPDGGLYIPEFIPELTQEMLDELCQMQYKDRAKKILSLYLTDYTNEEISNCVERAYGTGFDDNRPAPLSDLVGNSYFLELWHGPTCAFKDMALQLLPELLTTAAKKVADGKKAVILVATSGDTGKAALEGFRDVENTQIQVFYPAHGVSTMQKRQMCTQQGDNVSVVAIEGNFDDAQTGVKQIFSNTEISNKLAADNYMLSSANSINWGRLLPQIVYYVSAYCDLVAGEQIALGDMVNFCVPTGNFGNILAAHYARRMGLPINKLICASNKNNVLTDFIDTGIYNKNREFFATNSPSMDILVSSNVERLLFELTGEQDVAVAQLMHSLNTTGEYELPEKAKSFLTNYFWAGSCNDEETKATIAKIFNDYYYLCDTHTAVAAKVAHSYKELTKDVLPMIIVSTASPYKFADSVLSALGCNDIPHDDFEKVTLLHELSGVAVPKSICELQDLPVRFNQKCQSAEMVDVLYQFLNVK